MSTYGKNSGSTGYWRDLHKIRSLERKWASPDRGVGYQRKKWRYLCHKACHRNSAKLPALWCDWNQSRRSGGFVSRMHSLCEWKHSRIYRNGSTKDFRRRVSCSCCSGKWCKCSSDRRSSFWRRKRSKGFSLYYLWNWSRRSDCYQWKCLHRKCFFSWWIWWDSGSSGGTNSGKSVQRLLRKVCFSNRISRSCKEIRSSLRQRTEDIFKIWGEFSQRLDRYLAWWDCLRTDNGNSYF